MGLSLILAMIGLGLVIAGGTLLIIRKQRKVALVCLVVGLMLIIFPFTFLIVFFD